MGCGSGCCGPSQQAAAPSAEVVTPKQAHEPSIRDGTDSEPSERVEEHWSPVVQDAGVVKPRGLIQQTCEAPEANGKADGEGCCSSTPESDKVLSHCFPEEEHCDSGKGCCSSLKAPAQGKQDPPTNCAPQARETDCGEGCCGDINDAPLSPPLEKQENDCQDGCCSVGPKPSNAKEISAGCCEPTSKAAVVEEQCCSPTQGTCAKETPKSGCCDGAAASGPLSPENEKGCCPAPSDNAEPAPSCCAGITGPCCDESCLDRVAMRDCQIGQLPFDQYSTSESPPEKPKCSRGKDGKPCEGHRSKARRMYGQRLEALGCICRALIALGQETCCSPARPAARNADKRRSRERKPRSRNSVDSCCAATGADLDCCSKKPINVTKRRSASSGKSSCADACCAEPPGQAAKDVAEVNIHHDASADPEKGLGAESKGHVSLVISGMTCTGCETKLLRTLGGHPSVKNLKVSLVLARADFDLVGTGSAAEVIKHIERTTEFKCEVAPDNGTYLDVLAPNGDAAAFINQPWPEGVTDMRMRDKRVVTVSYDAQIIGARDLVRHGWPGGPVEVAPRSLDQAFEAVANHVRNVGYMTIFSAALTIPVLVMAWAPLPDGHGLEYSSASLALATIVQFVVAGSFYPKALKALVFSRVIEMDLLIVLSTSAAYIFSVVSYVYLVLKKPLSTGEFFETSTLLVTLIMVGRWAGAFARQQAVESISVRSLQSESALLVTHEGDQEIDARLLQYGDVFKVVPDSKIPTDGVVISGSSEVDESMITGESNPVEKGPRSRLVAGSLNCSGTLQARLLQLPNNNTISIIANMVDEAKLSKPKIQDIADRVASYFVPVVVVLTIITFCIWVAVGTAVRGQSGSEATIQAITYAITVLIVSCPCAIGLAVPMVIVIATGVAAERGVIFKTAESIEVAYKTSHVVFDKTGTITHGSLTVAREWYARNDQDDYKSLLLGLVNGIKHPVSMAVATHLQSQGISPAEVVDQKTVVGKGVEGRAKSSGAVLQAGNSRWLQLASNTTVEEMFTANYTAFCFTVNGSLVAVFGLSDSIRPSAGPAIAKLLARDVGVHLISGDDDGIVRHVAEELSIPEGNVRSRCTPGDKQAYIKILLETDTGPSGKFKKPVVMFCGDGTNDAVALAQATIGVHINESGTEVAKSAANIVLMRPDLSGILTIINVSRKSIHRVAFNFGWSFVYNLFAVLLAAGAFVNARIPPEYAGLGELVSVLPVIFAAMLLRWTTI